MLRDDPAGKHFDPRTVQLKFALDGENGVFLPLVLDIREWVLHWLDVHANGQFEMNNVETSKATITKICPELMMYFTSGVRTSMFDLGLLHAAARSERVFIRGQSIAQFVRRPGEVVEAFHARLERGEADEPRAQAPRADGRRSWRYCIEEMSICRRAPAHTRSSASESFHLSLRAICSLEED